MELAKKISEILEKDHNEYFGLELRFDEAGYKAKLRTMDGYAAKINAAFVGFENFELGNLTFDIFKSVLWARPTSPEETVISFDDLENRLIENVENQLRQSGISIASVIDGLKEKAKSELVEFLTSAQAQIANIPAHHVEKDLEFVNGSCRITEAVKAKIKDEFTGKIRNERQAKIYHLFLASREISNAMDRLIAEIPSTPSGKIWREAVYHQNKEAGLALGWGFFEA